MSTFLQKKPTALGLPQECLLIWPKASTSSSPNDAKARRPGCGRPSKRSSSGSRPASTSSLRRTPASSGASSRRRGELGPRPNRRIMANVRNAPRSPVDGVAPLHQLLIYEVPTQGREIPVSPSDDLVDLGLEVP